MSTLDTFQPDSVWSILWIQRTHQLPTQPIRDQLLPIRDVLQILSKLPPLPPIRKTCTTFFRRRNSRFESQCRTQNTIYYIIYCICTTLKQFKGQIIGILEEKDSFIDQKCTSWKFAKKLGQGPPPSFRQNPEECHLCIYCNILIKYYGFSFSSTIFWVISNIECP